MPAVKNVGEPCAGEPHARFEVAAGGNQASRASTCRTAGRLSPTLLENVTRSQRSGSVVTLWSAGINRHEEGDGSSLRRRSSDPRWPRVMRESVREGGREALAGGVWAGLLSREMTIRSGCRRCHNERKAMSSAALSLVAGGPCAVGEPRHARRSSCARTGRSDDRPW
jgi:hypothetical protein